MRVSINYSNLTGQLSSWGWVLLFPGFLFYHFFVALLGIQLPLAGLFGPTAVLIALLGSVLFLVFRLQVPKWLRLRPYEMLVTLFLAFTFLYIVIHQAFAANEPYLQPAVIQSVQTWFLWLALFLVSVWLPKNLEFVRSAYVISFIAISVYLGWYVSSTGSVFFYTRQAFDVDSGATYQGFARSAMVIAFLLLSVFPLWKIRFPIALISIFILFVLGARSELVAFVFAWFCFESSKIFHETRKFFSLLALLFFIIFIGSLFLDFELLQTSRQYELLNVGESSSLLTREKLAETGLRQLMTNPLLGQFGGHIAYYGGEGSYAHNIMSAWVQYGFVGFFVYFLLIIIPFFKSADVILRNKQPEPAWILLFLFSTSILLLVLTSKSIFYLIPPIAWGLYIRAMRISSESKKG